MKIVCVSTSRTPADTANSIQVMKACQGLAKLGHPVTMLLPDYHQSGAEWEALAERYGLTTRFEISWLPFSPRLQRNDFAFAAVRQARSKQADLLYTWAGQAAVMGLLSGLPVVYEIHDRPTGRLGPLWLRAFLSLKGKKCVALITQALRTALESQYGRIPDAQVTISPNGVDLEQYESLPDPEAARRELGLPQMTTVLCAGHLYAGRGVDLFLGLASKFPEASFVWVGGRPEDAASWRDTAAQKGLSNVAFTGFVSNRRLPCYQAAADVLLMPYGRSIAGSGGGNSADICSPMKMFDYLAAGRAILSSDLPVIREVLNETNAWFSPPEELPVWQSALGRLIEDGDLRRRLGAKAREDARQYSWQLREERILRATLTPLPNPLLSP